ncbi:MAG: hypothetical protein ACO1PB_11205 [Ramlibacter sp.]
MKAIFSIVGLLLVVAVIGVLAKKQLGAGVAPATPSTEVPGVATPTGTPQQQQEQFKRAVEGAMQQARPMPDEPK